MGGDGMEKTAAEIVRDFREEIKFSQSQLATVLKTSQAVISDIELGKPVSKKMAKKLAALTGEPIEKFI